MRCSSVSGRTGRRFPSGTTLPQDQAAGSGAVSAHLEPFNRYGMDVLKVMNDNAYPHAGRITRVEDLAALGPLKGDEDGFGEQLAVLSTLRTAVGTRVYMPTTIFNAWMVLRLLVKPPTAHMPPNLDAAADATSRWIRRACREKPELVGRALQSIGGNLARFAAKCVAAGADGIFLSVRDDWVDASETPGLYEPRGAIDGSGDPGGGEGGAVQRAARVRQGGGFSGVCRVSRAGAALGRSGGGTVDPRSGRLGQAGAVGRGGQSGHAGDGHAGGGAGGGGRGAASGGSAARL